VKNCATSRPKLNKKILVHIKKIFVCDLDTRAIDVNTKYVPKCNKFSLIKTCPLKENNESNPIEIAKAIVINLRIDLVSLAEPR
tara:strand:+ start:315 stop:566 length:252 start_codon:yes stop_codon:yes gene_type:complete